MGLDLASEAVEAKHSHRDPQRFPLADYFWIAGAEHLPLRTLDEKERTRRQSIIQESQAVRFQGDLARAGNRLGMGESPLSTSLRAQSYLSGSYKGSYMAQSMSKHHGESGLLSTSPMAMATSPASLPGGEMAGSLKKSYSIERVGSLTRKASIGPKGLGGDVFEMDGAEI